MTLLLHRSIALDATAASAGVACGGRWRRREYRCRVSRNDFVGGGGEGRTELRFWECGNGFEKEEYKVFLLCRERKALLEVVVRTVEEAGCEYPRKVLRRHLRVRDVIGVSEIPDKVCEVGDGRI